MQTQTLNDVVSLAGANAPDRVLVKFQFSNAGLIPAGIPEKERQNDGDLDEVHAIWAINNQLADVAAVGRERPGRVDTGIHVVDNLPDVQVAAIRVGLTNVGYRLCDAHWFEKVNPGRKSQYVVCLTFRRTERAQVTAMPRAINEALRELSRMTWGFCHVWLNPDGTSTVNLVGRRWDDANKRYFAPRHALVVRNRQLVPVAVEAEVSEADEAAASMGDDPTTGGE